MRTLQTMTPDQFVTGYGPAWRLGVLSEHLDTFTTAGGVTREAASGSGLTWAVLPDGTARPVVCSDIVEIPTEDGPVSGRCGADAVRHGACEGHAAAYDAYMAMSEVERAYDERQRDLARV